MTVAPYGEQNPAYRPVPRKIHLTDAGGGFPVGYFRTFATVVLYAVAMGYLEAAVVVSLHGLYYPGGFTFPLAPLPETAQMTEIAREAATIVMLGAVGALAGKRFLERFGWFLVAFGIWDIFYYVWLRVLLGWPAGLLDQDILFLIPSPWLGPVIAPVLVSIAMILIGAGITRRVERGGNFHPGAAAWASAVSATALILFSFMSDSDAGNMIGTSHPYRYPLLVIGLALYGASYGFSLPRRRNG
jgi:hypothetical protein